MLTIIEGSGEADDYFSKDNYYTKDEGIEHSRWSGSGAERLGLEGRVGAGAFKSLLKGEVEGQKLGRVVAGVRQHRSGWDLTFSAPKSLSILSEVFGVAELRQAHERAVQHALKAVEGLVQTRVTSGGVTKIINPQNAVFASFTHDVNRNLDCQIHTHNYLLNMTHTQNGWRSLYTEVLFKSQKEKKLGHVYRMALAKELVSLGYELKVHSRDPTLFEIEGLPDALIVEFSTRSKEIDEWFETKKIPYDPALAKTVALITRSAKRSVPREELLVLWKERAGRYPFDLRLLKNRRHQERGRAVGARKASGPNGPPDGVDRSSESVRRDVRRTLQRALEHLAERDMAFTRQELIDAATGFAVGRLLYEDIDLEIERLAKVGGIVESKAHPDLEKRENQYWTTPKLKALEASLVGAVGDSLSVFDKGLVRREYAEKRLEKTILNKQQKDALVKALVSKDRFTAIQGDPGVGKTTALNEYKKILARHGYEVLAMAPNYQAVGELESSLNVKGMTVDRYLADPNSKHLGKSSKPQVWIVDETSMLATDRVVDLMHVAVERKARVIFVGDHEQLESVGSGKGFKQLLDAGITASHLNEWIRPKTEITKTAFRKVMSKDYAGAVSFLNDQGRVREIKEESRALDSIADEWLSMDSEGRENTQIIAPTNEQCEKINALVRHGLKQEGVVGGMDKVCQTFVDKHMTGEQLRFTGAYQSGDVVRFSQEHLAVGKKKNDVILRHEYFDVRGINPTTNTLALQSRLDRRKRLYIDPSKVGGNIKGGLQVFKQDEVKLAKGDKVRWLDNANKLGLKRNTELTVGRVSENWVRFDKKNGEKIKVLLDDLKHLHFGHDYAKTAYGVQGATKKKVIAVMNSWRRNTTHARSFLVALTRAQDDIKLYVDSVSLVKEKLHKRSGSNTEALTQDEFSRAVRVSQFNDDGEAQRSNRSRLI